MEKLLKKVNEKDWLEFKAESARHGMRMGEFLGHLLKEHEKGEKKNGWEFIKNARRRLSEEDIKKMKMAMAYYERIYGFEEV